jgi:hypothetical protein
MQSKNPRDRKRAKSKSGTVQIRCSNDCQMTGNLAACHVATLL